MQNATQAVFTYLKNLYEQEPELFPNDEQLLKVVLIDDWKGVVSRLFAIRESESPRERLGHYRQMMAHITPSCMAEKILVQVTDIYSRLKAEQDLIDSF
jgi:hypothetical protein